MLNQIDLKDENYLKNYDEQIRKLPLSELYEILGIIKKDPSPERLGLVQARIHELESERNSKSKSSRKETRKKNTDHSGNEPKAEEKAQPAEKASSRKSSSEKRGKSHKHHHRHHRSEKEPLVSALIMKGFLAAAFGSLLYSRVSTGILQGQSVLAYLQERSILFALDVIPFVCFGIGYFIARSYTLSKKRAAHMGAAIFLSMKAIFGLLFESYLGFFGEIFDSRAMIVSAIVLPFALLYIVNLYLRKVNNPVVLHGSVPLAIAVAAEYMIACPIA